MTSKALAGVAAGLAVLTLGAGIASAQSDEDTDPTVTEQESPTDDQSPGESRPDGCDDAESATLSESGS